jgi:hypothetical protein
MVQAGTFAKGDVLAWTVESETGYTLREKRWTPRVGLRADGASGDRTAEDADLQTLNPLFPRGLYHQLVDLNGHVNFLGLDPVAVAHFSPKLTMTLDWGFFWRQSRGDGLYGVGGQLLRPGGTTLARYLGSQPSAIMEWRPQRHFSGVLIYTHFFPGTFLRETGPAKSVNYVSGWLSFKF